MSQGRKVYLKVLSLYLLATLGLIFFKPPEILMIQMVRVYMYATVTNRTSGMTFESVRIIKKEEAEYCFRGREVYGFVFEYKKKLPDGQEVIRSESCRMTGYGLPERL